MTDDERDAIAGDLRHLVDDLPLPNVRGKRCLDIEPSGTHLAADLERRGAAEVVRIDVEDHAAIRALDPADVGRFDIIVGRGVMRHVPEPDRALEAVRRVTTGMFLSVEQIDLWTSVIARGKPVCTPSRGPDGGSWLDLNGAGQRRMLQEAGFAVERASRPFTVPAHGRSARRPPWRGALDELGTRALTRSSRPGILHRALLTRAQR